MIANSLDPRTSVDGMTFSFIALHTIIHPRAVTEFSYRYDSPSVAHIFLSFILSSDNRAKEVGDVLSALDAKGMKGFDISDNELAKSHARYMVGGRSNVENERIFRFGEPVRVRVRRLADEIPSISRTARCTSQILAGTSNRLECLVIPLS